MERCRGQNISCENCEPDCNISIALCKVVALLIDFLFFRKFMKERGVPSRECIEGWTLQPMTGSKQHDGASCGLFVLMVSIVFKMSDFSVGVVIHSVVLN